MKVYKIRRISDGLFSTGGRYPNFTKNGKTWSREGDFKSHLALFSERALELHYKCCEFVKYEVNEIFSARIR